MVHTEDAELGLRIFEKGYAACYVPHSFGKGLMPDTFLDYKKQRFRWAYGSVLILRHHMMAMFGLAKTKLTRGQRMARPVCKSNTCIWSALTCNTAVSSTCSLVVGGSRAAIV